jgi:hypothetical protein
MKKAFCNLRAVKASFAAMALRALACETYARGYDIKIECRAHIS